MCSRLAHILCGFLDDLGGPLRSYFPAQHGGSRTTFAFSSAACTLPLAPPEHEILNGDAM